MPQGVRGGAQGSVVHRLPLEKGLPALPGLEAAEAMAREKERERRGWTDGCVTTRDFYQKENINQGPRAISCFTYVCFFTFNLFRFFPKGMLLDFFCIFVS